MWNIFLFHLGGPMSRTLQTCPSGRPYLLSFLGIWIWRRWNQGTQQHRALDWATVSLVYFFCLCTFLLTDFLSVSRQFLAKFEVRERLASTQNWRSNLNLDFKIWRQKMQERIGEQERKGLEQGVYDYLCLSAAKKLSKTITFSDKKWFNVTSFCSRLRHVNQPTNCEVEIMFMT